MKHPLIYLALLLIYACSPSQATEEEPKNGPVPTAATPVQLDTARVRPFAYTIEARGLLLARQSANLQFQQGGVIAEVAVQSGQSVAKGTLLARLDTALLSIALRKAQHELALKQEEYRLALKDRLSVLGQEEATLSDAQRLNLRGRTGLDAAELAYQEAKARLAQASLFAPFAGVVANVSAKPGDMADLSRPFCLLYNPQALEAEAMLLESDFAALQTGQQAEVWALGHASPVKAVLQRINPTINEQGQLQAYFSIVQAQALLPGMHVQARIAVPKGNLLCVPKEAVVMRSGKAVVFSESAGKAQWNYVKLGHDNGVWVEVLEGLKPQQRIIVSNNLQLAHDAPVSY